MTDAEESKCQALLGYLSDFIDGDLSPELCREIETHMEECHDCHVVVDTMRKTVSLYHSVAEAGPDVPGEVRERLFRTLNLADYIHH